MQFLQRLIGILGVSLLLTACSPAEMSLDYPLVFESDDYKVYGTNDSLEQIERDIKEQVTELIPQDRYDNASVFLAKVDHNEYTVTINEDDLVFDYEYIILVNLR